jgi:predicted metal-dependent enzyme (double-stranded beta helix superfamily)
MSQKKNAKGHITVLGESGMHTIYNDFSAPSRSIHVYGRDIGNFERRSYDPVTGEVGRFVSGYCDVLRDEDMQ